MSDELLQYKLEQYKLYVEMTDIISERRVDKNKFYTTLLTGLLALLSILAASQGFVFSADLLKIVFGLVGFLGVLLCIVWLFDIRAFVRLKRIKFNVINRLECEGSVPLKMYAIERNELRKEYGKPEKKECEQDKKEEDSRKLKAESTLKENLTLLKKNIFCERTMSEWAAPALLIIPYILLFAIAIRAFFI